MSSYNSYDDIVKYLGDFRINTLSKIASGILRSRIPDRMKDAVFSSWKHKCAICGLKNGESYHDGSLEAAHIAPVEEGGENKECNLIPLCKRSCRSLSEAHKNSRTIDAVGCHHLYDNEGAWSRHQIRELNKYKTGLKRPPAIKRTHSETEQVEVLKERVEHKISWPNKGKNPLAEIKEKLDSPNLRPSERLDLLICGLRLERRRRSSRNEVTFFQGKLSKLESEKPALDEKERIWYERAMVHFEFAEFDEALGLLRPREIIRKRNALSGGCLINEAQACVCEFEIERAKNTSSRKRISKIICRLDDLIPSLDNLGRCRTARSAWKTWPVTARLHAARMKAYLDDATSSKYIDEAIKKRDRQINADIWKYSLGEVSQENIKLEDRSGWSRYTQVLLLHAKGESLRASATKSGLDKDYCKAAEFLAIAARRIIQDRYKNFEYLDNVLEGLQKIPNRVVPALEAARTPLGRARNLLSALRSWQSTSSMSPS